jgi:hypothetical protein
MQQRCVVDREMGAGETHEFIAKQNAMTVETNRGVSHFVQEGRQRGVAAKETNGEGINVCGSKSARSGFCDLKSRNIDVFAVADGLQPVIEFVGLHNACAQNFVGDTLACIRERLFS